MVPGPIELCHSFQQLCNRESQHDRHDDEDVLVGACLDSRGLDGHGYETIQGRPVRVAIEGVAAGALGATAARGPDVVIRAVRDAATAR